MSASVVVPTRDRPGALRRCLASLREQGLQLEVIVVDDGSVSAAAVKEVAAAFDATLVRLEGRGPAAARNAGIAVASGDDVLLLDDDCVALYGWAETLVAAVASAERTAVAGMVSVPHRATTWLRASELLAEQAESAAGFFRTINLCARRELLLELPFDERFRAAAGEDRDWCVRAARVGVTFDRVAGAGVEHVAELGARAFLEQQLRYGRAARALGTFGTHTRMPGGAVGRGIVSGFVESPTVGLAMLAAHAATAVGYVREWTVPAAR